MRQDRSFQDLRPISFEIDINLHAEGSCLVKFGKTHVICTATIEEKIPHCFSEGVSNTFVKINSRLHCFMSSKYLCCTFFSSGEFMKINLHEYATPNQIKKCQACRQCIFLF